MTYEKAEVELLLAYYFNGEVPWAADTEPEPGMPKAASNPAHQGTHMAAMVDLKRAYSALIRDGHIRDRRALELYYGKGNTFGEAAYMTDGNKDAVEMGIYVDVSTLVRAMNDGVR